MELLTDILAIFGWIGAGRILPVIAVFLGGGVQGTNKTQGWVCAISFGLIAASLVLG